MRSILYLTQAWFLDVLYLVQKPGPPVVGQGEWKVAPWLDATWKVWLGCERHEPSGSVYQQPGFIYTDNFYVAIIVMGKSMIWLVCIADWNVAHSHQGHFHQHTREPDLVLVKSGSSTKVVLLKRAHDIFTFNFLTCVILKNHESLLQTNPSCYQALGDADCEADLWKQPRHLVIHRQTFTVLSNVTLGWA